MMITRVDCRGRVRPPIEPQPVHMVDGRPATGMLLHGQDGEDVPVEVADMDAANALVEAALALHSRLAVAIAANQMCGPVTHDG